MVTCHPPWVSVNLTPSPSTTSCHCYHWLRTILGTSAMCHVDPTQTYMALLWLSALQLRLCLLTQNPRTRPCPRRTILMLSQRQYPLRISLRGLIWSNMSWVGYSLCQREEQMALELVWCCRMRWWCFRELIVWVLLLMCVSPSSFDWLSYANYNLYRFVTIFVCSIYVIGCVGAFASGNTTSSGTSSATSRAEKLTVTRCWLPLPVPLPPRVVSLPETPTPSSSPWSHDALTT